MTELQKNYLIGHLFALHSLVRNEVPAFNILAPAGHEKEMGKTLVYAAFDGAGESVYNLVCKAVCSDTTAAAELYRRARNKWPNDNKLSPMIEEKDDHFYVFVEGTCASGRHKSMATAWLMATIEMEIERVKLDHRIWKEQNENAG